MKREFLQSLKVGDAPLSKEVIDAIMAENGKDIQLAKQAGIDWEEKYNQAVTDHERKVKALHLQNALQSAVTKAGGRNLKAISAMLDLGSMEEQEDLPAALEAAVAACKQEHGYLFYQVAAPYAAGTGSQMPDQTPTSLADALRQRTETL